MPENVMTGQLPMLALFAALVVFRVVNALSVSTFFQPDEYFQSLEPAWRAAFGASSGAWITWEWREQLRSSLHPLLFAGLYRSVAQLSDLLSLTAHARAEALVVAPRILQAIFAAATDLYSFGLARKIYGPKSAASLATLALTVLSPWNSFCSSRSLSNALETTLTSIALFYWPWAYFQKQETISSTRDVAASNKSTVHPRQHSENHASPPSGFSIALTAAALAFIMRPTNIIVWAAIALRALYIQRSLHAFTVLVERVLICGVGVLALSTAVDRMFYEQWTFPPLRFLYFNLMQSLAVFYGTNRPDYYFTEGLPLLLTTALPFAFIAVWKIAAKSGARQERETTSGVLFTLLLAVSASVLVLSLVSHKEVRFIYPLLPMLHVLAAGPIADFFHPFPTPAKRSRQLLLLLALVVNIVIASYTIFVHQRGVIDVMHFLRHEHEARLSAQKSGSLVADNTSIGFLMPCHSTPWRSHLVYPEIDAWALTCEPPVNVPLEDRGSYMDEADVFYAHPVTWIADNMRTRKSIAIGHDEMADFDERLSWPHYLVFFQQLEPVLATIVAGTGYQPCWRGFNSQWHDDWRRQGDVVVYCLR